MCWSTLAQVRTARFLLWGLAGASLGSALICMKNAPKLNPRNFHALTMLDENRAKCQLALKAGVFYDKVSNVVIWGNHSTTQVRRRKPSILTSSTRG